MKKPNTLLKVVSILYIVFCSISGLLSLVSYLGIGALLGAVGGSVSAGVGIALFIAVFSLIRVILGIVAGIAGVKAQDLSLCKVLAIILVVLAAISFFSALSQGENIFSSLVGLALPVLYTVGVYQQINDTNAAE